jgi:uncharacterized protein (TIGR02117 family)
MPRASALWLALLALPVVACSTINAPPPPISPPPISPPAGSQGSATIYLIARGWHSDIGLPVDAIAPPLATLEQRFPGVRFLTFGFGERQFVLTRRKTVLGMLTALLPSDSAVLLTALRASPQAAFGARNVVALRVSRAGLAHIEAAIWQQIDKDAAGTPRALADGPYPGSVFYAGSETYDGLDTCNTWTAAMLHAGGLPVSSLGVLFVGQVMQQARRVNAAQASAGHG